MSTHSNHPFHRKKINDRKIEVRRDLSNIKWKRGDTAEKYMTEIKKLGATFTSLGEPLSEAELSSYALNGLPNHYRGVRRVYEAIRPTEITLKQIRNSLTAEEENEKEREVNDSSAYKVKQNKKACFYCERTNHLQKDCWLLNNRSKRNFSTIKFEKQENRPELNGRANKVHEEKSAIHSEYYGKIDKVKKNNKISWTVDCGATCHMTNTKDILTDYIKKDCGNMTIADGTRKEAIGIGNVTFKCKHFTSIKIENVLYVPELNDCLLSINKLDETGLTIQFKNGKCEIIEGKEIKF